jgi:hypothetical protein
MNNITLKPNNDEVSKNCNLGQQTRVGIFVESNLINNFFFQALLQDNTTHNLI